MEKTAITLTLTPDEVDFLTQLMDNFPLSGNRQQLEAVLATMAVIRLKLDKIKKSNGVIDNDDIDTTG